MLTKNHVPARALIAAGLALCASVAGAANIQVDGTVPSWSNAAGGTNILYNGTSGTYTTVRWGVGTSGQSGLGFDPANPPSVSYPAGTQFLLGTLQHYNFPINSGTAASAVDLSLQTSISGAIPATETFKFRFLIDETPNATPCTYPSTPGNPCADQITFQNIATTAGFQIGSLFYTLDLLGFSLDGGNTIASAFVSQENLNNTAGLYAKFTERTPQVPEPGTLVLLSLGLMGLGFSARKAR